MQCEGLLVVISGPSGTGKGTLLKKVLEVNSKVQLSVSATTRKPRDGEIDGQNYYFKTIEEFKTSIDNNELVEWVEYCNNYYGTPKRHIEDTLKTGCDVILEIEVEGAVNVKKMYPQSVLIFVLPPSFDELKRRIEGRGTEKPTVIEQRLMRAKQEMDSIGHYDYIVINDTIEEATDDVNSILRSEKLRYTRNKEIRKQLNL